MIRMISASELTDYFSQPIGRSRKSAEYQHIQVHIKVHLGEVA